MAPRAMLTGLVVAALAAAAASGAAAHSSMTAPSPISRDKHCKVDFGKDRSSCPGPCPVKYLKPFAPVAKTYRGARFPVRWYKNNHQDGFVRWTVVPLDKANDAAAHAKGAFQYGCYSAGRYQCSAAEKSKHCTFDNMGVGYKATVDVPKNLPDGDYMLGWTWYGGQNKPSIRYSNYHDCARIRVAGGWPMEHSHQPVFRPGGSTPDATEFQDSCLSATNDLGRPDGRTVRRMRPRPFAHGRQPPLIPASFYGGIGGARRTQTASTGPAEHAPPEDAGVADVADIPDDEAVSTPTPAPPSDGDAGGVFGLGPAPYTDGRVSLDELVVLGTTKRGPLTAFPPSDDEVTVPLPAGGIVFVARAVGAVARVQFKVNGRHAATEVVYPYALGTLKADGTALAGWKGAWHRRAFYLEAVVTGKGGEVETRSWRLRMG